MNTTAASNRLVFAIPAAAALIVFFRILGADFVYDDLVLLRDNQFLRNWSALWEGFGQPFWQMVGDDRIHSGYYRPLSTATFTLLWKIGGGEPWVFHTASLLMHAVVSALVAALGLALKLNAREATLAGLIFAVHGAHVEPVAWASSLPDLISAAFCLAALLAWLKARYWVVATWIFAACLTKESSIGILLLLIAHSLVGKIEKKSAFGPIIFAVVAIWMLRVSAWGGDWSGGFGIETTRHFLEPIQKIGLSLGLILQYLTFLAFPWPHIPFQPLQLDFGPDDLAWWTRTALSLCTIIVAALVWLRNRGNLALSLPVGILFASLVPVLNTTSLGQFPFEERFLYLPSIGFALMLSTAAAQLSAKWHHLIFGPIIVLLATSSFLGASKWKNEETLYSWAMEVSPNTMTPRLEYGRMLLDKAQDLPEGNPERLQLSEKALRIYEESLEVNPDKWLVTALDRERGNVGLGNALLIGGDLKTAELVFRKILHDPDGGGYPYSAEAHQGLGAVLLSRGEDIGRRAIHESDPLLQDQAEKMWEESLTHYSRAIELQPLLHGAQYGLGASLAFLGKYEEALPHFEHTFSINPENFEFARGLAEVQGTLGKIHSAIRTLEAHLALVPSAPYRGQLAKTVAQLKEQMRSIQTERP